VARTSSEIASGLFTSAWLLTDCTLLRRILTWNEISISFVSINRRNAGTGSSGLTLGRNLRLIFLALFDNLRNSSRISESSLPTGVGAISGGSIPGTGSVGSWSSTSEFLFEHYIVPRMPVETPIAVASLWVFRVIFACSTVIPAALRVLTNIRIRWIRGNAEIKKMTRALDKEPKG
jgi:hypothetical protein